MCGGNHEAIPSSSDKEQSCSSITTPCRLPIMGVMSNKVRISIYLIQGERHCHGIDLLQHGNPSCVFKACLVFPKDISIGQWVEERVSNLASCTSHTHLQGWSLKEKHRFVGYCLKVQVKNATFDYTAE